MKKYESNEEDKKRKRWLYIIILIIILFSLITSCSCTSDFFGKIGDWFTNEGKFNIDDDTDDPEIIRNQNLFFDTEYVEMSLSDIKTKIGFSYQNINPSEFTCSTSNADIATCYVSNGYVVVIPKSVGEVTITLHASANGKEYEATTKVKITDATRGIYLDSKRGTLNLAYQKYKNIPYRLEGIKGDILVTSSDSEIATATAKNGILKIKGLKPGKVTITLIITSNGIQYEEKYTLTIIDKPNENSEDIFGTGGDDTNPSDPEINNPSNPNKPSTNPEHPVYQIKILEKTDPSYYLEDYTKENPYYIQYEITKDGISIDENVTIKTTENIDAKIVVLDNGEKVIKITPKEGVKPGDTASITLSSHGVDVSTTIEFKTHKYVLTIQPTEYNLNYTSVDRSKTFIINTDNLFVEGMDIKESGNKDSIQVCKKDKKSCVYIDVLEAYQNMIEIDIDKDMEGASSLGVRVSLKDGVLLNDEKLETIVRVHAESYQEVLKINNQDVQDVKINLVRNQILLLNADGNMEGYFTSGVKTIEIPIAVDETIDLSQYKAYGVKEKESCLYYPLISYNTKPDGTGTSYDIDTILQIDSNLTLYAIYDTTPENITVSPKEMKLYLTDVDLFHNEEYFAKYGKDKVIYPGAHGSYIMTIFNNTSSDLILKGLTLEENTVCVENPDGGNPLCLNMGYVIKYAAPEDKKYTYYYGTENKYTILNQDGDKKSENMYSKKIPFDSGLSVLKNQGVEISLLWEWVDIDNKADTAIGIYANEYGKTHTEEEINSLYKLTVSLDFAKNTCVFP